jgi:RNA-binding protein YlmH
VVLNLLNDKQKHEIISYANENPKLTQQQIADNLPIKWDLPIKRRTVGDILNEKEFFFFFLFIKHVLFILMSLYKCKIYVSRVETI